MKKTLFVKTPVADILEEPCDVKKTDLYDKLRNTQVLYGESLLLEEEAEDFLLVEVGEQKRFYGEWKGYRGWIRREFVTEGGLEKQNGLICEKKATIFSAERKPILFLSFGTRIMIVDEEPSFFRVMLLDGSHGFIKKSQVRKIEEKDTIFTRQEIVRKATLFLSTRYLWGGRSVYIPEIKTMRTGVDCSGLINLLFKAFGIDVPRDAKDQWAVSKRIPFTQLKPADLIFVKGEKDEAVSHVMLYAGENKAIEARGEERGVKMETIRKRLGVRIEEIHESEANIEGKTIYTGRVIENEN